MKALLKRDDQISMVHFKSVIFFFFFGTGNKQSVAVSSELCKCEVGGE